VEICTGTENPAGGREYPNLDKRMKVRASLCTTTGSQIQVHDALKIYIYILR
jgi:hypothetical protein